MFLCTSISILIFQYSILNGKIPPAPPPHRKCESSKVTLRKSGSGKNAHLRSLRKKSKISQAQYGQQRPTNVWYAEDFICNSHKKITPVKILCPKLRDNLRNCLVNTVQFPGCPLLSLCFASLLRLGSSFFMFTTPQPCHLLTLLLFP